MERERENVSQLLWPLVNRFGVMLSHYGRNVRTLLANDLGSIARFGSPFSSKAVVCRHCPVTLLLRIHETLKKRL